MVDDAIERVFESKHDTVSSGAPQGVPTITAGTLSGTDEAARHRRADAHRTGRHPAPLNEGRSRNMQANRRRDTGPELALRSALHRLGYRYRCDLRIDLGMVKVRPDIVFTRRKVAVFVDGCFWHCCPEHGRQPGVNGWYWTPKLQRNRERDIRNTDAAGWSVVRLWEHVPVEEAVALVVTTVHSATAV